MAAPLRLALAQLDLVVGDIAGNEERLRDYLDRAREAGAQLVLFPELAVTGYPPEDLLLKRHFLERSRAALDRLAADVRGIVAVVGFPELAEDVFNSSALLAEGEVKAIYRKVFLPNYGVFDEQRYFRPGASGGVVDFEGVRVGMTVCEDVWEPGPPLTDEALAGATLILNASASPYHAGKGHDRELMFAQRARDSLAVVAYCNLVGGQDELVFDGHSLVVDHEGRTLARAAQFVEELLVVDVDVEAAAAARLRDARSRATARRGVGQVDVLGAVPLPPPPEGSPPPRRIAPELDPDAEVYTALTVGLRDYVEKNRFGDVVLGLSGGIDSALVACIAVDALGSERVHVAVMPSPYSSPETQSDARAVAANLGVDILDLEIGPAMDA
jgi:NAD+ synthase (glutamine-hydrolysing)